MMNFYIQYDSALGDYSISDYLSEWSANFGDVNHTRGTVTSDNTGKFYGGDRLSGTEYGIVSKANNETAFIAEGELTYTLFNDPAHTLYGQLDSLSFGNVLHGGGTTPFSLEEVDVSFHGLDLSSIREDAHDGVVHQVIYGLMSGDTQALETALDNILDDYSLSVDATFDEVAAVVGVPADYADLLAA